MMTNIYTRRVFTFAAIALGLGCEVAQEPRRPGRSHLVPDRYEDAETGVVCYYFGTNSSGGVSCIVPKRMPLTLPAEKSLGEAPSELLPKPR